MPSRALPGTVALPRPAMRNRHDRDSGAGRAFPPSNGAAVVAGTTRADQASLRGALNRGGKPARPFAH
jgi:hypothetical protein